MKKNSSGKGHVPRPFTDYKKYVNNWDKIKNFGKNKKYKCDCHLHEKQVCDICQNVKGVIGKDKND
jgi:hypothetical protein